MRERVKAKEWFISLIIAIFFTDVAIILDVPLFRQTLGFLCFIIAPGLLMLHILRLNRISFLKGFLLSVGLSISFLMSIGVLINSMLPRIGFPQPLSTLSLVISFSVVLAILCFIAYQRNKHDFHLRRIPNFQTSNRGILIFSLFFPLFFPLLSILGICLMNTTGNNIILIIMFISIPIYFGLLLGQSRRIPKITYPVTIWAISAALLFSRGLTSNYLVGGDIYTEYKSLQIVLKNLCWSELNFPSVVTSSLSSSLLPAILQSLLGIDALHIYKVVFLILISTVPLIAYLIYQKFLEHLYAFLSVFFLMAQIPFMYLLTGQMRVSIALILFSLAIMVLLDNDIGELNKRILFIIFAASLVVAYYVTPVILFFLIVMLWLSRKMLKGIVKSPTIVTGSLLALFAVLIYFWWGQITERGFYSYVTFGRNIVDNLSNLFIEELRGPEIQSIYRMPEVLPHKITAFVNYVSFALIGATVMSSLTVKRVRERFDSVYRILMATSFALLVGEIVLPWTSLGYGADRLYVQLLIILAPAFVMGCKLLFRYTRRKFYLLMTGLMLVSLFFCNSFLLHHFMGLPYSEIFDTQSPKRDFLYVYDAEVIAANWLGERNARDLPVYISSITQPGSSIFEFTNYTVGRKFEVLSFKRGISSDRDVLVFLRRVSIINKVVYIEEEGIIKQLPVAKCAPLFANMNKIYANGDAEIYGT